MNSIRKVAAESHLKLFGAACALLVTASTLSAGVTARQIYYAPITEKEAFDHYVDLGVPPAFASNIVCTLSIAAAYTNTVIYYDQWENGFDPDISNPTNIWSSSNPGGTQIWGDGDPANGIPPGYATDVINSGNYINLITTNVYPHALGVVLFDGGDKIGATKPISLTTVLWPVFHDEITGDGVDLAEGCSVYDTSKFGTYFISPVGTDIEPTGGGSASEMFESTRLCIMASQDGTVVRVDANADGTFEATNTLAQGEDWSVGPVRAGAKVSATAPVQVQMLTGDIDAKYANRWANLYPTSLWSNDYYTPVGRAGGDPVFVFLYNAHSTAITITYVTSLNGGYGTFTVPANSVYQYTVSANTGTHFYTAAGEVFQAFTTIDTGTAHDWGAAMIPTAYLSPVSIVSFGPGSVDGTQNGSPVWVTAVKATTIYVDYDGDPTTGPNTDPNGNRYNVAYTVEALQSTQVVDTNDNSQTGMRIYTLDGVNILAMWGEGPDADGGRPYIDAGTAIIPLADVVIGDYIWNDLNGDGFQDWFAPGIPDVKVELYTTGGSPHQARQRLGIFSDTFDHGGSGIRNGTDGSLAWANSWVAANNATLVLSSGSDYEIQIDDDNLSAMTRSFVVPANTDRLVISYDYRQGDGNDTVKAQFSSNGSTWTDLASYISGTAGTGSTNIVVSTTPGTRYIRFVKTATASGGGNSEYMYFDNVSILAETTLAPVTATTDEQGYYGFGLTARLLDGTNYQLRVATNQAALIDYTLTPQDKGGDDAKDSDATFVTAAGFATIAFTAPAINSSNLTLDFGFNLPANLFGYLFEDENSDQIRNTGDITITNALVSLIVNGVSIATVNTDTNGYYFFADVPPGVVTVQVVQANATLVDVPSTNDVMRNRAVTNAIDTAVIWYNVISGYGVLAALPGEPLNFGYDEHPLSTEISLKAYANTDGSVVIEISTAGENGSDDIVVFAMIDGEWVEVARQPGDKLEGFGANTYTVEATGLTPGASYLFQVLDEAGHTFTSGLIQVEFANLKVDAVALDPQYFVLSFKTEPNASYEVHVSSSLGANADWSVEAVSVQVPRGWTEWTTDPFESAPGGSTTVRIFRNRTKAFFKIKKVN